MIHHLLRRAPSSSLSRSYSTSRKGGLKAKKLAQLMSKEVIPESTPQCYTKRDPHAGTFRDKVYALSVPRMLDRQEQMARFDPRKMHDKLSSFHDVRTMDKAQWLKSNKRENLIIAMRDSDLEGDLFKARAEFIPDFPMVLHDNLDINLTVYYAHAKSGVSADDSEALFDHAMFGNYIECEQTGKPGQVFMRNADPNKLYTLIMVCPDHPSRVNPDGHFVHWMIANIPGDNVEGGDVIKEYMPPLPTEYAGTFRYAFLVYEQTERIDNTQELAQSLPKEAQNFSFKPERQPSIKKQKRDSKNRLKLQYLRAYPYEREYWEKVEAEEERKEMGLDMVNDEDVYCSDFRPPPPERPADEKTLQDWNSRQMFDLEAFATQQPFASPLPVGLCFFQTHYDYSVTQRYQDMGIQEPFYIPVDFQVKEAKKKTRMLRESHFLRNQWM